MVHETPSAVTEPNTPPANNLSEKQWGDRAVTGPSTGFRRPMKKVKKKTKSGEEIEVEEEAESTINIRVNLDLRADVELELHAVVQGDVVLGLM
ncbi:hypothetical protein P168DRAFT_328188 [Aspergillus campestris IBT 28561]|uniref:Uncharacterized protein n=1 Tax=Aspergillus campestris (strain IBT 28561) TaxID=1392248 RepID=A0A2I1CZR0_ASPC2|nr:uncharacterized protein P168DRAFT_328188 [Aspergillus campestris IBT 28561]PKY03113.1 hypothetical protein P168DRAFT_328188 [Aspergillus campestris IBT 28561]